MMTRVSPSRPPSTSPHTPSWCVGVMTAASLLSLSHRASSCSCLTTDRRKVQTLFLDFSFSLPHQCHECSFLQCSFVMLPISIWLVSCIYKKSLGSPDHLSQNSFLFLKLSINLKSSLHFHPKFSMVPCSFLMILVCCAALLGFLGI